MPIVPIRQRDPNVPATIARAIEKSLSRDPEDRFGSASEMVWELKVATG